jgi:hypothetical protein
LTNCCLHSGIAINRDACMAEMTRKGNDMVDVTLPHRVYDPVGAAQCIDSTRAILSTCVTHASTESNLSTACKAMFVGTVSIGAACQSSKDCAASGAGTAYCGPVGPICVVRPFSQMGEPCFDNEALDPNVPLPPICADGLYCDRSRHCRPRIGAGAACLSTFDCEPTLWCNPGTAGQKRICTPNGPLGATCVFDTQCASGACEQYMCVPGTPIVCSI